MRTKSSFSTQTLIILFVGNAVLLGVALAVPGLVWVVIGVGVLVTLGAWLGIRSLGLRAIEEVAGPPAMAPETEARPVPPEAAAPPRAERPEQPPEAAAVQVLSILQREGRLIDFLQEDIQSYDDAQVGAAVRGVHEGCRQALREHVTLAPVMDEPEGSTVTLESGFDTRAIRLAGHVAGDPPFHGTLRHRGWRVAQFNLPELMQAQDRVVAAAEVEVG